MMIKWISRLFDFVFPADCPACGASVSKAGTMCSDCWGKITWISGCVCQRCGYPFPADFGRVERCPRCIVDEVPQEDKGRSKKAEGRRAAYIYKIRAACAYDEGSKKIVLPFKHSGKVRNGKTMANSMMMGVMDIADKKSERESSSAGSNHPLPSQTRRAAAARQARRRPGLLGIVRFSLGVAFPIRIFWNLLNHKKQQNHDIDLVVPVPLSYWRLAKRGYNQATVLARPIAKRLGVPLMTNLVARAHRNDQGHKSVKERRQNIAGVFRARNAEAVRGRHILIVDDVITTGATLNELARVLLRAGAAKVSAVSFARVVRDL
ncbi:MAG: ComF family protein [Rickettsiales bacterium]|jgi:ComF family protein|nr:ComF family protein [Rickettsiales bacterium]